jgi:hypothetical protein
VPIEKCGKIYIICLAKQAIILSVLLFKSEMQEWSLLENRENRIDPTQQSPHPSKLVRKGNKRKKHNYQINKGKQKLKKKRATKNFSKL